MPTEPEPTRGAPASPSRLCCDRMLARLARWLRAAGYDTMLAAEAQSDRSIAEQCLRERRVLITCDRHLASHAGADIAVQCLPSADEDTQALQLAHALHIDWTHAPFTRCMLDNAVLGEATARELDRVPLAARQLPGPFRACPCCGRVYWPGSHARRMATRLVQWRTAATGAGVVAFITT